VESSAGKHKVAFLMSDGDNIQWMCALTQQPKPTTAAEYRAATCSFLSFFLSFLSMPWWWVVGTWRTHTII
jgi:hypothetical protein